MNNVSKREQKREMILNAAMDMFLNHSYTATKIIDIAERVGIGKGTVYEYFASKEDMVLELIEIKVIPEYKNLESLLAAEEDFRDKIHAYFRFKYSFVEKYGRYMNEIKQVFDNVSSETSAKIQETICRMVQIEKETILPVILNAKDAGVIRDTDPDLIFKYLYGVSMMFMTEANTIGESYVPEYETYYDFMMNGIRA